LFSAEKWRREFDGAAKALLLAVGVLAGCESLDGPGPALMRSLRASAPGAGAADEQRRQFVERGEPKAIRSLLRSQLHNGMSVGEVESLLGLSGERVHDDQWVKTEDTGLLRSDVLYKWGPDNRGRSYYLAFRDGRLTNHDPQVYADE
jgi:hypothetical protein